MKKLYFGSGEVGIWVLSCSHISGMKGIEASATMFSGSSGQHSKYQRLPHEDRQLCRTCLSSLYPGLSFAFKVSQEPPSMVHHSQHATDSVKVDKVVHVISNHSATNEFVQSISKVNVQVTHRKMGHT